MVNVSDNKKIQSLVNVMALQIEEVRSAVVKMKAIRTKFNAVNPSTDGTCISGCVAAINSSINDLDAVMNTASSADIWDGLADCWVASHRGEALE